ncbi:MAG TPA: DinB family protein [Longimicrobiaceae bacterium]|nr:DinB family protein [Longimicrobiaceae bacterium]
MPGETAAAVVITPDQLLEHWQGHRRLTRRMIEAFPEDKLFSYSLGSMRPFGALALEMLGMAMPMVHGIATDEWNYEPMEIDSKQELLRRWDEATTEIQDRWGDISADRFQETMTAFGQYTMPGWGLMLYVIDNEVHHRGQGYVYLRAMGVEPPPFYDRD